MAESWEVPVPYRKRVEQIRMRVVCPIALDPQSKDGHQLLLVPLVHPDWCPGQ